MYADRQTDIWDGQDSTRVTQSVNDVHEELNSFTSRVYTGPTTVLVCTYSLDNTTPLKKDMAEASVYVHTYPASSRQEGT